MTAPSLSLDHVQLAAPAGCEAQARAFFGELLGLVEVDKPEALAARGGVWFALASGQQLHVGVERAFAAAGKAHPAFRVESVDALRELATRLTAHGHVVTPDDGIPGVERFYCPDPWGNRLEFLARLVDAT